MKSIQFGFFKCCCFFFCKANKQIRHGVPCIFHVTFVLIRKTLLHFRTLFSSLVARND